MGTEGVTKVRCIDQSNTDGKLKVGYIYTIIDSDKAGYEVYTSENVRGWFYRWRFEGVDDNPSPIVPKEQSITHENPLGVSQQAYYTRYKIQPITFIRENDLPFWVGNIIKYVCRHDAKDGLKDLKKARDYLDKEIARMEGKESWWLN